MGPIWHFIEESMRWCSSAVPVKTSISPLQHAEWDWLTVAVATCSRNCTAAAGTCVAREHVVGFNLVKHPAQGLQQGDIAQFAHDGASTDASSELMGG